LGLAKTEMNTLNCPVNNQNLQTKIILIPSEREKPVFERHAKNNIDVQNE